MRVSDFGEVILVSEPDDAKPDLWICPVGQPASARFLEAFRRGELTMGGLAEAGWRCLGTLADPT
jgi:hypothetical protein